MGSKKKSSKAASPSNGTTAKVRLNISSEDFVRIWQESDTVDSVVEAIAEKSGVKASNMTVTQRARNYRLKGVPLKKMPRQGGTQDWDSLKELAKELAQ